MYFCEMNLEKVISQLILKHACVIVPDFGGFISQRIPAVIDYKSKKILPPSKSVLFNKQLLSSDGLLIGVYANQKAVSYDMASTEIKETVSTWKSKLSEGQRIAIEHIGYLYLDKTAQVCFEQDKFVNLLLSSYGLPGISVAMAQEVTTDEVQSINFIDFNSVQAEKSENADDVKVIEVAFTPSKKLHWTRYVAVAALLPIAFYSFWIPVKTDFLQSGILSVHDFNPFKKQTSIEFTPTKVDASENKTIALKDVDSLIQNTNVEKVYAYEVDGSTYQTIVVDKNNLSSEGKEITTATEVASISSTTYYIIGNCFGVQSNADNYVASMQAQGLHAEVVDNVNGLYRVAIGKATAANELEQVKEEIQAKGISEYWVLKK